MAEFTIVFQPYMIHLPKLSICQHKQNFNKTEKIEIIQIVFYDHDVIKLEQITKI